MARPGFAIAMKNHFKLESESNMDFLKQLKSLSDSDRAYFYGLFQAAGYDCDPPAPAAPGAA